MKRPPRAVLWVTGWLVAALLVWLALRGIDWRAALAATRSAHVGWLLLAVLCNLAILWLWAALWRVLLPPGARVPYVRMFEITAVTSAIMNTVPALVGHASAVALLTRRGGLPPRTSLSLLALDQVVEGITKLAVFALAVAVVELPPWMRAGAVGLGAVVAVLVGVLWIVGARAPRQTTVDDGARGTAATGFRRRLSALHAGLHADFHVLRRPRQGALALVLGLAMKGAEAAAIACVLRAVGADVPMGAAFVVLGATNLATMLPVAPGNLGTYEAGAVAAYRWLGVPPELALAAALLQHGCFLLPAVGAGLAWLPFTGTAAVRGALATSRAVPPHAAAASTKLVAD